MDAKTIDLNKAKTLTLTIEYQDGTVDIITDCQVRPFLKYLKKDAELGRAAGKVMDKNGEFPCGIGIYRGIDEDCKKCVWLKFCRLRAERGGENG